MPQRRDNSSANPQVIRQQSGFIRQMSDKEKAATSEAKNAPVPDAGYRAQITQFVLCSREMSMIR